MSEYVKCNSCRNKFTLPTNGGSNRTPVLLACGHTYCTQCVTKWAACKSNIDCPRCHYPTSCLKGKSCVKHLWPNLYIVGLLSSMQSLHSISGHFLNFNCPPPNHCPSKNRKINQKCSECVGAMATCRCAQCQVNMCKKCFGAVHNNSRFLRQHHSVPLRPSLVSTECKQHHRLLEFYCENEARPVCPECLILPDHQDHKVVRMIDKYSSVEEELKNALSLTCTALSHSDKVKSSLSLELENIKFEAFSQADYIHQCFQDCVGSLQARFLGVLRRLETSAQKSCDDVLKMLREIENKERPIREACEDTELVLSEETRRQVVVEPEKLLTMLKLSESLPFQLDINESPFDLDDILSGEEFTLDYDSNNNHRPLNKENRIPRFKFSLDPAIPMQIQSMGEITVNSNIQYSLNLLKDCPGLLEIPVQDIFTEPEIGEEIKTDDRLLRQLQEPHARHQELIYVTSIDNPCKFQVQRCVDKPHIDAIERSLKVYSKRKPMVDEILARVGVGDCCTAFYQPARAWYRARVLRILKKEDQKDNSCASKEDKSDCNLNPTLREETAGPKDMVEVMFIDFGNIARTQVSCLRRLPQKLKTIPDLALPCALNNITPIDPEKGWAQNVNMFFSKMIGNRPLLMTTIKREMGCRLVDLHKPAPDEIDADVPISVRDALLFLGLARLNFTPLLPTPTLHGTPRKYLTPSLLPVSSFVSVNVCYMVSLNKFSVQLLDSNMSYLLQIMKRVQSWVQKQLTGKNSPKHLEGIHPCQVLCPYEEMVCLAKYLSDGQWYRAKVLELLENQTVRVLYVDYGDVAEVHVSCLLKIPENFTRLPVQALECELCDVAPLPGETMYSDICLKRFQELVSLSQMLMEVRAIKDGIYQVDLFDYTDEDPSVLSVGDRLYREGFIARMNKSDDDKVLNAAVKEDLNLKVSGSEENRDHQMKQDRGDSLELQEKSGQIKKTVESLMSSEARRCKARVTNVINPDLFYLQMESQMENLNKMMFELQRDVEDEWEQSSDANAEVIWSEGQFCVAHSKIEKRWCRCCVEKCSDKEGEGMHTVRLIDYGWVEQCPVTHLRKMPEKFTSIEKFISKCCLASVQPAGGSQSWTSTAATLFQELVRGEDCLMEFCESKSNEESDILPVELLITKNSLGANGGRPPTSEEEKYVKASRLLELEGLALPTKRNAGYADMLDSCSSSLHYGFKPSKLLQAREKIANPNCWPDGKVNDEKGASTTGDESCDVSVSENTEGERIVESSDDVKVVSNDFEAESVSGSTEDVIVDEKNHVSLALIEIDDDNYRKYRSARTLPVGEYIQCTVSHIENPCVFYMRRTPKSCDCSDIIFRERMEWQTTMDQIQDPAQNILATLAETDLVAEEPCLCRYLGDEMWHRAIILSYNYVPKTVIVQYVDFGTKEKVPVSRVRRIPDSLFDLPLQCHPCQLVVNSIPMKASDLQIIETFTREVGGKDLLALVYPSKEETEKELELFQSGCFDSPTVVTLYSTDDENNLTSITDAIQAHL